MLGAGFEPAEPFRATVLQTVAIDHSAIPARRNLSREWDSNPRPIVYKTIALPLSYLGNLIEPRAGTAFASSSLRSETNP